MIIPLIIGAVAIFIWSKFAAKKPVEKTALLEGESPTTKVDVIDILKKGAAKVVAIVGAGGAAVAAGGGAAAAVGGGAALVGATTIGVSALPAATVLPAGLSAMAPTTLSSAVYGGTPAVVGTGTGSSSIGAGVGGSSGVGAAIGGAAMVVAPLIVVPLLAKALDKIFGTGKSGLYDNPELLAKQLQITKEKEALIGAEGSPLWIPKSGFWEGDPG